MCIFIFVLLHLTNRYPTDRTYMYYSIRPTMNWHCIRILILDHTILVSNNRCYPCAPSYPHHTRPFTTTPAAILVLGSRVFHQQIEGRGCRCVFKSYSHLYLEKLIYSSHYAFFDMYPVHNLFTFLQSTCEGATSCKSNSVDLARVLPLE